MLSALLYLPGLYFYIKAKREQGIHPFQGREKFGACALTVVAVVACGMIWQGGL